MVQILVAERGLMVVRRDLSIRWIVSPEKKGVE